MEGSETEEKWSLWRLSLNGSGRNYPYFSHQNDHFQQQTPPNYAFFLLLHTPITAHKRAFFFFKGQNSPGVNQQPDERIDLAPPCSLLSNRPPAFLSPFGCSPLTRIPPSYPLGPFLPPCLASSASSKLLAASVRLRSVPFSYPVLLRSPLPSCSLIFE